MREVKGCELLISFDKPSMNKTNIPRQECLPQPLTQMFEAGSEEKNGMCARLIIDTGQMIPRKL